MAEVELVSTVLFKSREECKIPWNKPMKDVEALYDEDYRTF